MFILYHLLGSVIKISISFCSNQCESENNSRKIDRGISVRQAN